MPEDSVPVGVEGDGYAATLQQALDQQEVAVGVLLFCEEGVDHRAGGIVHCDQQRERRRLVPQPPAMTAVHLDRHAPGWHALTAHPVLGRASSPWTAQSQVHQDAPQSAPADVDAVALTQQLAKVGVIGSSIPRSPSEKHGWRVFGGYDGPSPIAGSR